METIINSITMENFKGEEVNFRNCVVNVNNWSTWKDNLLNADSYDVYKLGVPQNSSIHSVNTHDGLHIEIEYFNEGKFYKVKSQVLMNDYNIEKGKTYIIETHTEENLKREDLDFASNIIEFLDWNEYKNMMLDDKTSIYIAKATNGNLKKAGNEVNNIIINDKKHLEIEYFNKDDKHFYNSKSYMFIA